MQAIQYNPTARWILLSLAVAFFFAVWARTQSNSGDTPTPVQPTPSVTQAVRPDSTAKPNSEKKANRNQVRSDIVSAITANGNECRKFRKISTISAGEEKYRVTCNDQNEYQVQYDPKGKKWSVIQKESAEVKLDTTSESSTQNTDST